MTKTEATSQPTAQPDRRHFMQVSGALIGIIALILAAARVISVWDSRQSEASVRGLACQPAPAGPLRVAW